MREEKEWRRRREERWQLHCSLIMLERTCWQGHPSIHPSLLPDVFEGVIVSVTSALS